MSKLILLSVIIASIVNPAIAAHMRSARLGLRKTLIRMAVLNAIYVFLLMFVWPRF